MTEQLTKSRVLKLLTDDPDTLMRELCKIREDLQLDLDELKTSIDNINVVIRLCIDHRSKIKRMNQNIIRLRQDIDCIGKEPIEWKDYALEFFHKGD